MKYLKMFDTTAKNKSIFYYLDSISFILVTECFIDYNGNPVLCLSDYRLGYERKPVIKVILPDREDVYLASRYTMIPTNELKEHDILIYDLKPEISETLDSLYDSISEDDCSEYLNDYQEPLIDLDQYTNPYTGSEDFDTCYIDDCEPFG